MNRDDVCALTGPLGEAALAAAAEQLGHADTDRLHAVEALRRRFPPELASLAVTQELLRRRGRAKFGPDAPRMLFTPAGLEQATTRIVADHRAARLVEPGAPIADLGCGIGGDLIALSRAGASVTGIERDPATALVAQHNLDALGLAGRVECADLLTRDFAHLGASAAMIDPARRSEKGRLFDPAAYSPPWEFVARLAEQIPAGVAKLAPGFDHRLIPPGWEAEWVSLDGAVKELALWWGPGADTPRRATLLPGGQTLTGSAGPAPAGPLGRYLFDPDGAIVRAHLLDRLAEQLNAHLIDPRVAYLTGDQPRVSPLAACFEIEAVLPLRSKALRSELRRRGIGRLEILTRAVPIEPTALRRELALAGDGEASLICTRIGRSACAILARRATGDH